MWRILVDFARSLPNAPPGSVEIDLLAYVTYRPWTRSFLVGTALGCAVWWGFWITALAEFRLIADTLRRRKPFPVGTLFAGVIVLIVAEVFRLGAVLEDEQALTI